MTARKMTSGGIRSGKAAMRCFQLVAVGLPPSAGLTRQMISTVRLNRLARMMPGMNPAR